MAKKETLALSQEIKGIILIALSLIMGLSLITYNGGFPHLNWLGLLGYGIGFSLYYLFGLSSYLVLSFCAWIGLKLIICGECPKWKSKTIYFAALLFSTSLLLSLLAENAPKYAQWISHKLYVETTHLELPYPHLVTRYYLGGVPLYYLYRDLPTFNLQNILSDVGIGITFSILNIVFFLLLTELPLRPLFTGLKQSYLFIKSQMKSLSQKSVVEKPRLIKEKTVIEKKVMEDIVKEKPQDKEIPKPIFIPSKEVVIREPKSLPATATPTSQAPKISKREQALKEQKLVNGDYAQYRLPPATLLKSPKKVDHPTLKKDLKRQAEILEETLMSFGIEAKVGEINPGPRITSFEVHPAVGVKVQKIKSLENDIALNLQAPSIRIIAPIPGKAAVGVEIPSLYPQEVSFKELLLSYQQGKKLHVPILLGKSVGGELVISDLTRMPHCIIAGATGSGKSVCINTLVMSIVMTARPDEIKLLMVDPKKVELTAYSDIPHMIAPVITEAHGAYAALNWLVKEMQLRYDILKQLGLRNITAFNQRKPNLELEASLSIPIPTHMPFIIAIIDEFADLMMASSSDLETPIARIAQMARAVGIHLVLATQRPSREVITGLIKANFPTRISFKVASRINSQIILDDTGAESLLGNGDMLFLPPGSSQLIRAQGAFISDEEINSVIDFIKNQAPANYLISSFDSGLYDLTSTSAEESSKDTLYDQARSIVVDTGSASTTFLQRKLKIGYARAASLMDELETKGIIGPQEGARPRRVLVTGQSKSSSKDSEFFEE